MFFANGRKLLVPAILAGLAIGLGACGSQSGGSRGQSTIPPMSWLTRTGDVAPAPAPAPTGNCANYNPNAGANFSTSMLAFPTGDVRSSGLLVHHVMPREVRANQPYEYQIHVTNITGGTLQNVTVNAGNFQNQTVTATAPAATAGAGGAAQWVIPSLASCRTEVIRVTARADRAGQASSACVTATFNQTLCNSTNVVEPALAVTKTMTPGEVLICDPINMVIEVRNTGSGAANNVKVRDQLPAGLTTADGRNTLEFDAGTLAAGQSRQFTAQLKATKTGAYQNDAQASADGGLSANSQQASTVVRQPVLTIKAECPAQTLIGRNVTFKYTVCNTGDAVAPGTVVTATVPANTTFVSADGGGAASGGTVTWNVGNLAPRECKTFNVVVRTSGMGEAATNVTANARCAAQVTDTCKTSFSGSADIGTLLTDRDGVVLVGDNHTYIYEVENQGQIDLTNVKGTITLDANTEFVSAQGYTPENVQGKTFVINVGTLKPREKRSFTFTVRATRAGDQLQKSVTTSDQTRRGVQDDEYTEFVDR
jgi:uncharacterized repeat protein (TIGR01451 family)